MKISNDRHINICLKLNDKHESKTWFKLIGYFRGNSVSEKIVASAEEVAYLHLEVDSDTISKYISIITHLNAL